MATLRVLVGDETVYEGSSADIPRVGDRVQRGSESFRVESATWEFPSGGGTPTVTVLAEDRPYTF